MEMTDGIDFEAWNATVRALAISIERLERATRGLAAPPWIEPLLAKLEELNGHLRWLEDANLCLLAPDGQLATPANGTPPSPGGTDSDSECREPGEANGTPDLELKPVPSPVRTPSYPRAVFGDPEDIARYGRRRKA